MPANKVCFSCPPSLLNFELDRLIRYCITVKRRTEASDCSVNSCSCSSSPDLLSIRRPWHWSGVTLVWQNTDWFETGARFPIIIVHRTRYCRYVEQTAAVQRMIVTFSNSNACHYEIRYHDGLEPLSFMTCVFGCHDTDALELGPSSELLLLHSNWLNLVEICVAHWLREAIALSVVDTPA